MRNSRKIRFIYLKYQKINYRQPNLLQSIKNSRLVSNENVTTRHLSPGIWHVCDKVARTIRKKN